MIRLLKSVITFAFLVAVAYAGFRWGGVIFPTAERLLWNDEEVAAAPMTPPGPSAEVADATLDRFERFRADDTVDRMALDGVQLSSVVRYSLPGLIPAGVSEPTVELADGRVRVGARIVLDAIPALPELREVVQMLPDTVPIQLEGSLVVFDPTHLAFFVESIEASGIPLPQRIVGKVLEALGRDGLGGLPANALAVPLPAGLLSAYVQGDSLVLVADR